MGDNRTSPFLLDFCKNYDNLIFIFQIYDECIRGDRMKEKRWFIVMTVIVIAILSGLIYQYVDMDILINGVKKLPMFYKIIAFIGLVALQIVFAFLPGEPLELAAGYMFGSWLGTLICLAGCFIGTAMIYFLVKIFKHSLIHMMFQEEKINEVKQLMASKKSIYWFFIIFIIPGSPKDLMTYVASLTDLPICRWLVLTSLCRIPSIVTSTFLSGSIKNGHIVSALVIFLMTIVIVISGMIFYKKKITGE